MQQKHSTNRYRGLAHSAMANVALLAAFATVFVGTHMIVAEMDKADAQAVEQHVQVVEVVKESAPPVEVVETYDIPLDEDLQLYIISLCEGYQIDDSVVFAMIQRESSFQEDVIGDNGDSFGLMQVQPKWHSERMERLDVNDLLDPYQNVQVGIDYLAELLDREKGLEWAVMAYNAGPSGANSGFGKNYASAVLENSEILKEGMVVNVLHR